MNRFFLPPSAISGDTAVITGDDALHITKVLRLREGDMVELCDMQCGEYAAQIEGFAKGAVALRISERTTSRSELPCRVTLYQCLPKGSKLETVIQKCVELGVWSIVPAISKRCVVKPEQDRGAARLTRYNRIALEAAKQSKRGIVPYVKTAERLADCDFSQYDLAIAAYEEERVITLKQLLSRHPHAGSIALVVGPEGGFEREEIEMMRAKGVHSVTLGSRILRTETAAAAMLAMIAYEMEQ
ncbi:MAG: RsmE family RNA methyltransferase [Clostridia bacterium]|nr:RsmE family RNA methyltransferase [Clostridia bacterium]